MGLVQEIPGVKAVEEAGAAAGAAANPVKTPETYLERAAKTIQAAGEKYKVNPAYLWGIFGTETGYGSDVKTSSAGAIGAFQFEPATAKEYGYPLVNEPNSNSQGAKSAQYWENFTKQAEAAAHYLNAHGGQKNITAAVQAYNPGSKSYLSEVLAHAKTFADQFGNRESQLTEASQVNEAKPSGSGASLVEQIFGSLGKLAITGVLYAIGAVLIAYGILVAIRPRESALSIPIPVR